MDPFCGRGTTLFAARKLGLNAWGVDSSPVAVAIAKAKLATCEEGQILELAQRLLCREPQEVPTSEFFNKLYSPGTLRDVCALREGLLALEADDTNASVLLRALALGALHGPLNKDVESSIYFSNQMPRTFASKPDYSVRYWDERGMRPPQIDVLRVLRRKLERLSNLGMLKAGSYQQVIQSDSQSENLLQRVANDFSIVVTSPPYYGMRTYVQDQWLRHWFLGADPEVDYSSGPQLEHCGVNAFAESLGKVWKNMAASDASTLRMFVRFGIIPSAKVDAKEVMKRSLEASNVNWNIVSVRSADTASKGKRQATQMKSKSAAAIEYDYHIVRE